MNQNNLDVARAYYTAIGAKNVEAMEQYVHPNIQFVSPFSRLTGKSAYLEATRSFTKMFGELKVRALFGSGDQVMLAYDLKAPNLPSDFSAAVLMNFDKGLVSRVELFFDPRPFMQ